MSKNINLVCAEYFKLFYDCFGTNLVENEFIAKLEFAYV